MKLLNNKWIDDNNNSWSTIIETEESAIKKSATLIDCSYCSECSDCSGYESNPQRIVSNLIGSRKSPTTIYWIEDNIQVACGCFKGSLIEFEDKVKKVHGDNEHGIIYMKFINKVKAYMKD